MLAKAAGTAARRARHGALRQLSASAKAAEALPLVDLSRSDEEAAEELRVAAGRFGFFYVSNHGVPREVEEGAFTALASFFANEEVKGSIHQSKTGSFRGYVGPFEQGDYGMDDTDLRKDQTTQGADKEAEAKAAMDYKELFHFGTELPRDHAVYNDLLYCDNIWPNNDPSVFREPMSVYYEEVRQLSDRLLRVSALALGLEPEFFVRQASETPMTSMNCLHYPPLETGELGSQIGIGAHTDFECLTILNMRGTNDPCLEIIRPEDGAWMPVAPREGCFVVNVGDMLARWSGDTFRSTVHRAFNHPRDHRYSIAFFRGPDFDASLAPQVGNKEKYMPPVNAGKHMLARITQANPGAVAADSA
ncbi:1-aminocyclopropane-1-carboxylate oxidase-like 2 [Hondaea fermentalgiana]|uniref:1-aminocyclopropane-1-carboxylate oxidase-like 2 n=1 Tax=Hondaea fermentalgiana TaxID=2315210 RepID=A0A2R5G734_9STRA|nr:1-aminocyclopropane-1-carboxylate oxidase-like 2 [Hondaea fermentalgiana]|eukprot:GBG26867.1 1-aminocyclopropane-1-carboxylate oxidase-like 2 [Hondaea fermentalgiana]